MYIQDSEGKRMNASRSLHSSWFFFMCCLLVQPAWAALGQIVSRPVAAPSSPPLLTSPSASAPANARILAPPPVARPGLYTVQKTQLDNGTTVQEYATPAGLVFAVAWQGPVLPDLYVLLGNYFSTFKFETDQARLQGRRGAPVDMSRDGLVVRSNGRMRNFFGHAYVADLVPAGVSIKDILQ